jgi:peroxisomal 2,4-dienoyl-CoA reductase
MYNAPSITVVDSYEIVWPLLFNCVHSFLSTAEDLPPNGWKTVMDIDANGTFNMCHASFPELKKSGDAVIISISAYAGYGAAWYQSHAFAAKAAVDSLTRSLALEWAEFGIRAVAISPGAISDTPGFTKLGGGIADEATVEAAISATIPAGRTGSKTEIGHTALFLASPSARYITGVIVTVDGGAWYVAYMPFVAALQLILTL